MKPKAFTQPTRRQVLTAVGAAVVASGVSRVSIAKAAPGLMTVTGPIPATPTSKPYGSVMVEGTHAFNMLKEYDYVEEEYFCSGTCNVYGPGVHLDTIPTGTDFQKLQPLSKIVRSNVPYRTRMMVVRPRDLGKCGGNVHAIAFHNLGAGSSVERNILRNHDVWIGIEASNGTKFGPQETLSGGVAQLQKFDKVRYGELSLPGGKPEDWPDLTPGNLGRTSAELNFGQQDNYAMAVFQQEIHRGYAQGPDLLSQLVRLLKEGHGSSPLRGAKVRHTFNSGASGGTTLLTPYIEFHHDHAMLPDGRPPYDGYLVMVGIEPLNRPKKAVLVILNSEDSAKRRSSPIPPNTDEPKFRYYEIPSTGHSMSAPAETVSASERAAAVSQMSSVLPEGIAGLTDRGGPTEYEPYDKINTPINWGAWANMYAWLDKGKPMPIAPPIERDSKASDGIARDEHGNAKGGIRTPWVDVPEATYVAEISEKNPLSAGMKRFDANKIDALYGSREAYVERCKARVDVMVNDHWIQAIDAPLMKTSCK